MERSLCLFRGKVVAEQKQIRSAHDGRMTSKVRNITDHKLIRELLLNKTKTDKDLLIERESEQEGKKDL